MIYTIKIENLEFRTIIGILDFERKEPQLVRVDAKIKYERKDFIDYVEVVNLIKEIMKKEKFLLIEDAIDAIEKEILIRFDGIKELYLSIKKPEILKEALVGVEILRKY